MQVKTTVIMFDVCFLCLLTRSNLNNVELFKHISQRKHDFRLSHALYFWASAPPKFSLLYKYESSLSLKHMQIPLFSKNITLLAYTQEHDIQHSSHRFLSLQRLNVNLDEIFLTLFRLKKAEFGLFGILSYYVNAIPARLF